VAEFGELAGQARRAAAAGDAAGACELYERALGLWRGQPLEDVGMLYGHPAITELGRRRAAVVLDYADAAVGAGQHDRVTGHLEALAAREPLDERLPARLMGILAATGRQAAALRVYAEMAGRLDLELGISPGPELAAAHLNVLRQQDRAGGPRYGRMESRPVMPAFGRRAGAGGGLWRSWPGSPDDPADPVGGNNGPHRPVQVGPGSGDGGGDDDDSGHGLVFPSRGAVSGRAAGALGSPLAACTWRRRSATDSAHSRFPPAGGIARTCPVWRPLQNDQRGYAARRPSRPSPGAAVTMATSTQFPLGLLQDDLRQSPVMSIAR
jgi:hypothetical protein